MRLNKVSIYDVSDIALWIKTYLHPNRHTLDYLEQLNVDMVVQQSITDAVKSILGSDFGISIVSIPHAKSSIINELSKELEKYHRSFTWNMARDLSTNITNNLIMMDTIMINNQLHVVITYEKGNEKW